MPQQGGAPRSPDTAAVDARRSGPLNSPARLRTDAVGPLEAIGWMSRFLEGDNAGVGGGGVEEHLPEPGCGQNRDVLREDLERRALATVDVGGSEDVARKRPDRCRRQSGQRKTSWSCVKVTKRSGLLMGLVLLRQNSGENILQDEVARGSLPWR